MTERVEKKEPKWQWCGDNDDPKRPTSQRLTATHEHQHKHYTFISSEMAETDLSRNAQ